MQDNLAMNAGTFTKQNSDTQELVSELILHFNYLFGLRGNWSSHWTEIAQRIYPMEAYLFQNYSQLNQMGDKRNFEVFDSTGVLALQRFGSIMDSLLTPMDAFWHQLHPQDPALLKDKACKLWFETANNILFNERYKTTANFASQNQKQYLSLGAYGTGVMFIDGLSGSPGIRYKNVHLGECYLQENHQGVIDALCRHFMMTAKQAVQMFGDNCPEMISTVAERFPERQFFFLHWVKPRSNRDPERKDYKGMEYASYYVSIEAHHLIWEGGYRQFPYAASRYFQAPNEAYGRSLAMDVLPALKTLNEEKKSMLKQGHRVIDPVLLVHDDGILDGFSLEPGALNPGGISSSGQALVQALPTGNVQAGAELMKDERDLINDTFLISLFQILTENPEQTATEVLERTREKGILLAPTIGRQKSEYLGPLIERELDVLTSQGRLPPMPPLLKQQKGEYKVYYDSPISRTQKAEWSAGAMRTIESLMTVAQATNNPGLLDYIKWDKVAPAMAEINGTPASWINDQKDVNKIRVQRQQQQQQQQAIQAAPAVAGLAKSAAGMPPQAQAAMAQALTKGSR
jgi:hypothetical protein